jgi:hypothetical protein
MPKETSSSKKPLVSNRRYAGKFVATPSFQDHHVVAAGKDPQGVMARARRKGFMHPVVFFVPAGPVSSNGICRG